MKRVSTFAILKSLLNPLPKKSLPKIALFALLLMATACEGRVAASGITLVTPLPPDGAVVTASPIAVAELVNGKLSGSAPYTLQFTQMYAGRSVRYGLTLSDYLKALDGQSVTMEGYMAPPLKSDLKFFVLTEVPMSLCPFCSSNADWPDNIIAVYMNSASVPPTVHPVKITGRLEIGSKVDDATGFVSMIRVYADKLEVLG